VQMSIAEPKAGWSALRMAYGNEPAIELAFSYSPEDSIAALAEAADAVASGPCERIVVLREEPATVDIVLKRSSPDSTVTVTLVRYPDHRRHLPGDVIVSLEHPPLEFARAVWRALRQLESCSAASDYEREWRHPFPARAISLLGSHLV
jgi:hypothetical protein